MIPFEEESERRAMSANPGSEPSAEEQEENAAHSSVEEQEEMAGASSPVADEPSEALAESEIEPPPEEGEWLPAEEAERRMHRLSRRGFIGGAFAVAGAVGGWRWFVTRPSDDGILAPLRTTLRLNERLAKLYFRPSRLAPNFPISAAGEPKPNGDEGLGDDFDPATWSLTVHGLADHPSGRRFSLADIQALPRTEIVTELKCIEGWSQVVRWAGARLLDFAAKYPPVTISGERADPHERPDNLVEYVGMETPDRGYYVGLDRESALHPQTLLCYEMNGEPLSSDHGAPLRLVIPVKYGIKHIKRIGTIRFTRERPADYWAEQGYDWYAGH